MSAPWENSESQRFILITGANSGLGYAIATRLVDEFLASSTLLSEKHLILILCTRSSVNSRSTVCHLREHLKKSVKSSFATSRWSLFRSRRDKSFVQAILQRVHIYGAEVDLCNLRSIYKLANQLVNGFEPESIATDRNTPRNLEKCPNKVTTPMPENIDGSINPQYRSTFKLDGLTLPRIDVVILSAGMGGWAGINLLSALKDFMCNPIASVTWPKYKIPIIGALVKPQLTSALKTQSDVKPQSNCCSRKIPEELPLGEVFCSNVFGHYLLVHRLMPLLSQAATPTATSGGKIIWVSSIEAMEESFSIDDMQCLRGQAPYESSKRLIDLLVLGSELPSVNHHAAPFYEDLNTNPKNCTSSLLQPESTTKTSVKPKHYLTHPGVFVSKIMKINFILVIFNIIISHCVRFFGSPWHTIDPYKAAITSVWLAMTDNETLEELEANGLAKVKWGSATDPYGKERNVKTEVPGWGCNGCVGKALDADCETLSRRSDFHLDKEAREAFEILSGQCWKKMEELRTEWERILGLKEVEH